MQCARCQAVNREGRRFCGECGAALPIACPACGFANEGGERYCGGCGAPLANAAPPGPPNAGGVAKEPAPAGLLATPEQYTPSHLAVRILTSRGALEGERKQVTVLFADLKGSMELLADRDPEEARRLLDPVVERLMEAVHRYEGTVNQVQGDGIMALFGAPLAHEDHAVRACYAALRMQASVREYAAEAFRAHGVRVQIRVGLNSGEVVVRAIGSDLRMDYTAVGQTTHLAARMEQTALPGSILLAPDTLRLVEGYVQVQALGPVPIKGLDAPVAVYELVGAAAVRARLQAAATRGLTRFVGRDAEVDVLRRTLEQAAAGHGQVIALVGEPGVGKSRLVWEFAQSHRSQGWLVLESASVSYGKATSYLPAIDLLKGYFQIEAHDDHRRMRQKVLGKLLDLDEALRPTVPAVLALLDVPVEDAAWQGLDPPQRRQRTLDGVKRLLLRESQEQPLLLVFEDLHWIDAETQALLDGLVESLPTAQLLLLVNYRPEYEHAWHRKSYYRELRLDPLPAASADALLDALLGADPTLAPLRATLIARTEGNPFFLEESVRALAEAGVLAGERGAYRLARPLASVQVPATVQAVLAARIDRLPPEDKRLLQAAAVVGKDVPYALLAAIAELPDGALREGLARLQAAELLYETSLYPDPEYTFKHALTHEVAYGGLLQERRRALHARIVAAIEGLSADRLAEHVERLAHHAHRGEAWEKAVAYLRQAGAKAAGRSAHREAVAYFEQALEALGHPPASRELQEAAIDLRFDLRNSLLPQGEYARILQYLREAEPLAEALGDRRRLGWVAAYNATNAERSGEHGLAIASGRRAVAIADEIGDARLRVVAGWYLGRSYAAIGQYREAVEVLWKSVRSLEGDAVYDRLGPPGLPAVMMRRYLVETLAECGEFEQGIGQFEEALRIAEAVDQPFSLAAACIGGGELYLLKGDLAKAVALLRRALGACETWQIAIHWPQAASALGYACALSGDDGGTVPLLEQAVERAASGGLHHESVTLPRLGEAHLMAGRRPEAIACAERALELARRREERAHEAWALRLLGEIAARGQPPDVAEAEARYGEALAVAEALGMRPLAAHCHLGLGTLYGRVGRAAEARADLTAAAALYRAMDMMFWLARAEAAAAS